jgi:hypothetical protein
LCNTKHGMMKEGIVPVSPHRPFAESDENVFPVRGL